MSADALLSRLRGVQGRGPYRAICPAHESKRGTRTLAVRETDDGRVLVHCFAGCDVNEILAAVGLELDHLFPPRVDDNNRRPRERRPFHAADALRLVEFECFFPVAAARKLASGQVLDPDEHDRLLEAVRRISSARQACGLEPL